MLSHFGSMFSLVIGAIVCANVARTSLAFSPSPTKVIGTLSTTRLHLEKERTRQDQRQDYPQHRRDFVKASLASTAAMLATVVPTAPAVASYIDPITDPPKITNTVYLDVVFGPGEKQKGRLVIGLYGELMPKTVENFESLCASNKYAGTTFYRVISDLNIQGGAVGDKTGKTGQSSFPGGKPFEPDNYNLKHTQAGLVSAVRGIGGSADSRFFINTKDEAGWADDRYAAFGIVQEGMELVKAIEKVPVAPPKNAPKKDVTIVASGVLKPSI